MKLILDPNNVDDYRTFLAVKRLPTYSIRGCVASFPDEYASAVGVHTSSTPDIQYEPSSFTFDYQRAIASIALRKRKFAVFADCGLGKTIIYFEWLRALMHQIKGGALLVSPLMVIPQTISEAKRFYGDELPIEQVASGDVEEWLATCNGKVGITNYEAFRSPLAPGQCKAMVVDESSMLKSHYGRFGTNVVNLGRQLQWVLAGTGTPAPNDRIEYANHAVMLGQFPTVNSFLATYFVNRGQTQNRWELKPHALEPFYRALSHWCIFLCNPATYGWRDNTCDLPAMHVHIHEVPMTRSQMKSVQSQTGNVVAMGGGGITGRSTLSRIAKGLDGSETNKFEFMRDLVATWSPDESTLLWCWYNDEQDMLEKTIPGAGSISGATKIPDRLSAIEKFKSRDISELISKPKILGFGLNLQVATRMVFSSLIDSYESYYQAIKRANRHGATRELNVHIPILDVEYPMVETVLQKAKRVQADTEFQERIFKDAATQY